MAIKMDKASIIVCSVLGSLGLLSAIMGFSAEGTKLTPYTILVYGDDCLYPQNPAIGLGICAAIFLLVAQVIFSAVGGCCKSRSIPSETKRIVGIVCAVVSWIAAVIAFALFIEGASWNANVVRVAAAPYCPYLKDGVFAGAGVLTLAATALGIASFIMLRSNSKPDAGAPATATASAVSTPSRPGGQSPSPEVVMGHPLLPASGKPQNQPSKPQQQGYGQAQVPPPESPPQQQGYAQAPQNLQSSPLPAAAQDTGSHVPNQQLLQKPEWRPTAATACAASEPALGVPMGQPLAPLPQVHIPNDTLQQYPVSIAAPQVVGAVDMPCPLPATAPPAPATGAGTGAGNGPALATVIRNEVARQGIKFAAQMVTHSILADNNDGVQATN